MICRNCGAGLEADGIDTTLGLATCAHCGSLHDIPSDRADDPSNSSTNAPAKKPRHIEVTLPSRYKVRHGNGSLEVSWSAGGLFHGLVLTLFAGVFGYVAVTSGLWFMLIAAAGILYFAATRAFNEHRIRADGARLTVKQGPLPCTGSRTLDASDIVQLYATEHVTRTQNDKDGRQSVNIRKHYRLSANTRSSGRVKIIGGLSDPFQALWLEQEIENLLGITDKPVSGEHIPQQ